jgi:hypothetical protein
MINFGIIKSNSIRTAKKYPILWLFFSGGLWDGSRSAKGKKIFFAHRNLLLIDYYYHGPNSFSFRGKNNLGSIG